MKKLFPEIPQIENERLVLRKVEESDIEALQEMVQNPKVYSYLPTFLFEKRYADLHEVVRRLYDECLNDLGSLILGIHLKDEDGKGQSGLCGLAEFYEHKERYHKVSVGCRLLERYWGQAIATDAVALMVEYLYSQTNIELITASTMTENAASSRSLEKAGFVSTARAVEEDWGYDKPTIADKWFC